MALFTGCKKPIPPSCGYLRISFPTYPSTIDARISGDEYSSTLLYLIREGLTRCSSDGTYKLAVAERIDISEDQKTYLFHLRKSTWSDGHPVTAHDFEKSWKQIINPKFPSLCAYLFFPILNAEAAFKGLKSLNEVGIRALDAYTLQVVLEHPTPYFLSLTWFPSFLPVPQHMLQQLDKDFTPEAVINGPFRIEKTIPQSSIVLRKNPRFWNRDQIRLEGVDISIVPNETTALAMFQRKELDWLGGFLAPIAPDALASLTSQKQLYYHSMAATTFCAFNTQNPVFKNENIRRAFGFALDREMIARQILHESQIPATRVIPPSLCNGKNRDISPSFNPQKAKTHLQKGLEELRLNLDEINPISLYFRTETIDRRLAQMIQQNWEEVLGVKVELCEGDFKTYNGLLHSRDYQVSISHWIAQYQDPLNILERFKDPKFAKNYPNWNNPEYFSLIDQIQESGNREERDRLIEQAEDLLIEQLPLLPIYHWKYPTLCHPRVLNLITVPAGGIRVLFEGCSIDTD